MKTTRGFTLVELLLALGLISVLLLPLFMSYRMVVTSRRTAETRINRLDMSRAMLEKFHNDVRSLWRPAFPDPDDDEKLVPLMGNSPQSVKLEKLMPETLEMDEWSANGLTFARLSHSVRGMAMTGEVVHTIRWQWEPGTGELTRDAELAFDYEEPFAAEDEDEQKPTESHLSCPVDNVTFEYYDGKRWLDKWNLKTKNRYPDKISLRMDFGSGAEAASYAIIAIPFIARGL